MPTCVDCGPGTTPAVITAGDGLTLTGVGTPSAPYHFDLADSGASQLSLEVRDSSTVNFTLYGSGSTNDPYVLSADTGSVAALTSLSDYSDPNPPNDGEVVTWVAVGSGGHWQSKPLPGATAATTSAAALTSGILSNDRLSGVMLDKLAGGVFAGDANTLLVPGMYHVGAGFTSGPTGAAVTGTLEVLAAGTSVTQVFWDTANKVFRRTKYNASDWTSWSRLADASEIGTGGTGGTSTGGATYSEAAIAALGTNVAINQGYYLSGVGGNAIFRFNLTLTGTHQPNDNLVQLPSGWRPKLFPADFVAHNGTAGGFWGMAIDTDGWLRLRTSAHSGGGLWGSVSFQSA